MTSVELLNKIDKLPKLFDKLLDLQEELKKYSDMCGASIVYNIPNELIVYAELNKKEFEKILKAKSDKINGFDVIQRGKYIWRNITEGVQIRENCKESAPIEIEEIADKLETINQEFIDNLQIHLCTNTIFLTFRIDDNDKDEFVKKFNDLFKQDIKTNTIEEVKYKDVEFHIGIY